MNNTELPIAPLSVYEADPAFPQDEEGRRSFYDEYFSARRDNVKSSTDVESWLNDRYEFEHREMAKAAAVTYAGRDPEEVKNLFSKSEEELKAAGETDAIDYIKWNDEVSKKKIEADNINKGSAILAKYGEDKIVKVKPFKFNEKDMLEVTLPDGTVDLIDGEIQPDFADSLIKHHSNKFTPEEKLKFYDAWNQTVHGTKAAINETKKGFYGIYSGLALDKVRKLDDYMKLIEEATGSNPDMDDPRVKSLSSIDSPTSMDEYFVSQKLARDIASSADSGELMRNGGYKKDELIKLIPKIKEAKTKAISKLLDSFKQAGAIKGSQALDKFNRELMSKRNGRDNATGFTEYFDKNPDELMPWISATVASSLPDVGIGVGLGLVGSAAGGPLGGAAAAGSWGVKREYTASVLESLQSEASKRGMRLNKPENINTLLDDKEFMDAADKKAKIRAGIIGATDAISGGLVGNITKPLKNVVGKIAANQFIEAGTEYSGEIFAQYATEGKVKFSEGIAEALGGIAAAPVAAVSEISDHKAKAKENVAAAVDSAKATVFEAVPGAAPKPKPAKGSTVVDVDFTENNPAPTPPGDINTSTEPKVTTTFHPQRQIEYSEDAPKQKQLTFPTEEQKASKAVVEESAPIIEEKSPIINQDQIDPEVEQVAEPANIREVETPEQRSVREEDINLPSGIKVAPQPIIHPSIPSPFVDQNGNTGVEMTLPITNNPQEEGVHFIDAVHGTNVPELTNLDPAFSGDTNRLGTAVYLYPAENEQDSVDFAKGKAILEGGTPTLYKTRIHAAPENIVDLNKPIYLQDTRVWKAIYNALGAQRTPGTSDSQPLNFFFSTLQPEEVAKLAQNGIKLGIFKQEDGPTTYAVYDGSAIEIKDSRTLDTVFGNPTPVTPEPVQPLPSDYITTVYHGTYATIESSSKPYLSVDFINTGERTQNEGWGIYLTDKQAIGQWYKSSVSQMHGRADTEFYLDGKLYFDDPLNLDDDQAVQLMMERLKVNSSMTLNGVKFYEENGGETVEATKLELIQEQLNYIKLTESKAIKKSAANRIKALKAFDTSRIEVRQQKLGNAYKVNIKYNEGEMLELEKPYDEQSDKVKAAFDSYPPLVRAYNDNPNDSVYKLMIEVWNYSGTGLTKDEVKKELSMNYLKNGVKLSRYYTGETRHSDGQKEYNYVVFDDGVIEMVANIEDESKSWPERILDVLQSANDNKVSSITPEERSAKIKKIFEEYQVNDPLLADLLSHDYIREALENVGSTVEEIAASFQNTGSYDTTLPAILQTGTNQGMGPSINKYSNELKGLVREFIRASNNRTAAKGIIFQKAVNEALSSGDLIDIYNYDEDIESDVNWAYNLKLPGQKKKPKTLDEEAEELLSPFPGDRKSVEIYSDASVPSLNDISVVKAFDVYGFVRDDGTIHVFHNLQVHTRGGSLGTLASLDELHGFRNYHAISGLKTYAPVGSLIHAVIVYDSVNNPQPKIKSVHREIAGKLFKAVHPSIAIGEMISSLTGAPSPLDAAYEIMKAHLIGNPGTLEEMTRQAISGMPVAYADEDINTQAQVREGVKLYNPFIRFSRWAKAMTAKFAGITKKILADIYNAVRSVYNKANGVTKAFSNRYGINLTPDKSSLTAHSYMQAIAAIDAADGRDQSTPNLKGLLEYIIDHPASSLNEKRLARYILKSQGSDQLSKVPIYYATKKDKTSYFNPADVSVIFTNRADAYVILHEAMHTVTYNWIQTNMNLVAIYDKGQTLTPQQKREWLRAAATGDIDKKFVGTKFVDNEFRIIAGAYMDAYDAMKLPLDSPYGDISEDGYSYYKKYKGIHHYGIVNLHEFATEAYTNRSFGYTIGQIPSTNPTKVSSTVLKRTVNFMLRVLGVPIWNAGVLAETTGVIHDVLKNNRYDIDDPKAFKYFTKYHNTWINTNLLADSTVKALAYANEPSTPETRREEIINSAVSEQNDAEFGLIKKEFPEAFEADPSFVYDGTNLPQARRLAIDWLDEKIKEEEESGGQSLDSSFNRDQEIMRLMQADRAASSFFRPENVVNIPTETVKVLRSAYQHLSDSVIDVDMMTNRQISRLIQIFSSLKDGQVPVGMKSAVNQWFTDTQINKLLGISSRAAARVAGSQGKKLLPPSVRPPQQKPSVSFRDPIANWRRRPIFGLFDAMQGVEFGSMATQAAEIAKIAPVEEAYEFITDIFSHLKGNVETQEIESRAVIDEFDQTIKKAIPKGMTYTQAHKIGWVANLTQYKDGNPKALEEMTNRLMLAGRGINTRKAQHGNDDVTVISEIALMEVTKGLRTGSVPEIINSLEASLTPGERKVLDKVREVGQRYRNALGAVSAITAGRPLEDIVNYSHHKVIHRNEEHTQSFGMAGFRSLEPVMQLRRGFNPEESWFDSDIISIFDDMVNQATYEAHTGIQRMMLHALLNDRRFAMAVDENYLNPVRTDRLKVLLGNWHAAKVNSGNAMNSFMAFASNAIGIPTGALIIGFNSFLKNFSSAIPGRVFAVMQTHGSINPFTYETNRSLINKFIKDRVPGVDARLSRYENPIKEGRMSSTKERFKLKREGGKSILQAAATSGYRLVPDAVRIIKKVVDAGAHLSNAIPDAFHAKSVWIQAYLYKLIQDKKISHANDWIAAPFFDSAASTYATSVTDNAFGYAGRREDKGEFWYGNSVAKQVMARALLFFSQQAKGIAIEAQTNLALSISLARHPAMGASAEKHAAKAVTQILNSTIFRSLTAILSTTAVIGGLSHFLDGYGDDEEKKRAIEEAERQRADAIRRINKKDALYELITTVIPVTTANPILEPITERFLDDAGVVVDRQIIMDKSLPTEEISLIHKQQVDEEIKAVDKEVKRIKDIANGPLSFGMSDADKNRLEKLDQYRKELSEVKKFKYFPNDPVKAAFHMLGGFGIAGENAFGVMDRLFEGDLDSDEKKQLKEIQQGIENENDPWSVKAMTLELLARLKIGSNPKTTVERAKRDLAQQRIKEMKEKEEEINKLRKSFGL